VLRRIQQQLRNLLRHIHLQRGLLLVPEQRYQVPGQQFGGGVSGIDTCPCRRAHNNHYNHYNYPCRSAVQRLQEAKDELRPPPKPDAEPHAEPDAEPDAAHVPKIQLWQWVF
jgi:hypothetical protein